MGKSKVRGSPVRGRPKSLNDDASTRSYHLMSWQHDQLDRLGERRGTSASAELRRLLDGVLDPPEAS